MLDELLTILLIAKQNKDYVVADRLKKFLEDTFKIVIGYTQNSITYCVKNGNQNITHEKEPPL